MSLSPAQLRLRKQGITATDLVALSGESPWASPFDVFVDKTTDELTEPTLPMEVGHAMEPIVMSWLADKQSLDLVPGKTARSKDEPWLMATHDRLIREGSKVVGCAEAKFVGRRLVPAWFGENDELVVPGYVEVQVQVQMGVKRLPYCIVAACLGDPTDEGAYVAARVDFDPDFFSALVDIGRHFREEHVLKNVPPPADASVSARRMLEKRFPRVERPTLVQANDAQKAWIERYLVINEHIKALEAEKDGLGNKLREAIGDAQGLRTVIHKATWTTEKGRVDYTALCKAFDIPEKEADRFRGPTIRKLRVAGLSKSEIAYVHAARQLAVADPVRMLPAPTFPTTFDAEFVDGPAPISARNEQEIP